MKNKDINYPIINKYEDLVYYLKKSYERIFKILDTVISVSDNIIIDKALNIFYTGLLKGVGNALNRPECKNLKKSFFNHPDNLLDLSDGLRIMWEEETRSKSLNFLAQIEKLYIKTGNHATPNNSFEEVMAGIDIATNYHIKLDKQITKKRDELLKNQDKPVLYIHKETFGTLMVKGFKPITFKKGVASVLNLFYTDSEINNSFKTYRDFERREGKEIKSSEFRKKIDAINQRIAKETGDNIKGVIYKEINIKNTDINQYKWKVLT